MLRSPMSPAPREPEQPPAHIVVLPTELLLMTFDFVYFDGLTACDSSSCTICIGFPGETTHMVWQPTQDLTSPSLFPYSLSSVCSRWRNIMSTVPKFWTRLVFFVDSEPRNVQSYFAYSGDLPISVTVTRKFKNRPDYGPFEGKRAKMVMAALRPHIHRCESLSFDVKYSSSLPSLRHDFVGEAPLLTKLILECKEDDGGPTGLLSTHGYHDQSEKFICSALTELTVDGRNFLEVTKDGAGCGWRENFPGIVRLSIIRLSDHYPDEGLSIHKTLDILRSQRMPNLFYLRMSDVRFASSTMLFGLQAPIYDLAPTVLELEDLQGNVVDYLSRLTTIPNLDSMFLTRCIIDCVHLPDCWSVTLDDINPHPYDPMEHFDYAGAFDASFSTWGGGSLDFVNSSSFSDSFLLMISSPLHGLPGSFGCPNVQEIHIVDCMNFTVGALKNMVAARNEALGDRQADVEDDANAPVIVELNVTGRGPPLSAEDAEWFKVKVALFHWDIIQVQ
ncbi:hypothetical protein BDQ12DRAFT_692723 [Crucibulum laeve]|uniref:F-box domain-containing protein n=1 Tax=Crucibulum laeve TaxID=68775 RepID=A0A5C3LHH2_9AGAR|nr:hypothetical protein BDQ12DRAFT_692723 [Crucibulum laeve]